MWEKQGYKSKKKEQTDKKNTPYFKSIFTMFSPIAHTRCEDKRRKHRVLQKKPVCTCALCDVHVRCASRSPDPEVVGVEVLVLVRVLERPLVVLRALSRFSQDELPVALALGEVPALLIALGTDKTFPHNPKHATHTKESVPTSKLQNVQQPSSFETTPYLSTQVVTYTSTETNPRRYRITIAVYS